jgi:hypothetical protein
VRTSERDPHGAACPIFKALNFYLILALNSRCAPDSASGIKISTSSTYLVISLEELGDIVNSVLHLYRKKTLSPYSHFQVNTEFRERIYRQYSTQSEFN